MGERGQSVDAVAVRGKGRRKQVLDTAVDLLASGGERAMTFHGVDDAAGVPRGSTSNHFRTRDALRVGVCAEVLTRRAGVFIASAWPNGTGNPHTVRELTASLSGYVLDATDASMTATGAVARAHLSLVVLAQVHPELRQMLAASDLRLQHVLHTARCVINPAALAWHTEMITDYLTGVITTQISAPREKFNPRPGIAVQLAATC
ncbi:AcrR family transcriptional regulator [Mycobacteroides chelonae]|nr:AcrR family transcriptional regulator [Mycobacteroides chelonae]